MTELEVIGETTVPEHLIGEIAKLICDAEDPESDYHICIKIVESEEMKQLNRVYRGVDKATDVLSFVTNTGAMPLNNVHSHKSLPLKVCDIIIDIKQLALQKVNKTLEEEFCIVLIHGLLHIVGYDHIRKHDACEMETKENYYQRTTQGERISGRR
ncbi:MAG: rRNA maturation RNase YbeY [Candidatus Cloacimonetes bacterium HGW-Cloacimonetes-3]|jgi:probable rRNA maturation factor|nr:MAG: rRNA maturation RNase YbeY [Candidatus Cloacimonetes bacterium HGW-Cloacimonetes-3]